MYTTYSGVLCNDDSLILTCACACRLKESLSVDLAAVETAPACRQCGRLCDSSVVSVLQHSVRALTPTPDSVNRILYLERPAACKKVCTFYNTI